MTPLAGRSVLVGSSTTGSAVRARVRSGEDASESEVVRDGLRALIAEDQAVVAWLLGDFAAAAP